MGVDVKRCIWNWFDVHLWEADRIFSNWNIWIQYYYIFPVQFQVPSPLFPNYPSYSKLQFNEYSALMHSFLDALALSEISWTTYPTQDRKSMKEGYRLSSPITFAAIINMSSVPNKHHPNFHKLCLDEFLKFHPFSPKSLVQHNSYTSTTPTAMRHLTSIGEDVPNMFRFQGGDLLTR